MNSKINQTIEEYYEKLLDLIFEEFDQDLYDLTIELKTYSGETIKISWKDRDERLKENESS